MSDNGWYYLHTNGSLIFKRFEPESDSTFVKRVWSVDITDRLSAWTILIESLALGADKARVKELAQKWRCDVKDLVQFMCRANQPTRIQSDGLGIFLSDILDLDSNAFYDWLGKTAVGEKPNWETLPRKSTVAKT